MSVRYLSVCSGIEGATLAWNSLGWEAAGFAETEKFPSAIIAHHYPDVRNFGDFTAIDQAVLGHVDILVGGTPCQSFSVSGKRLSLADARGNLSLSYVALAHELARHNGLRNAVWENVPGVLSMPDNAFGCFLGAIVGHDRAIPKPYGRAWPDAGMADGPRARCAWRILDAEYWGLAQRRARVFLVADFGNGADPAEILFEPSGLQGNPAPRHETREGIAPTISARTQGGGGLGTDFDLDDGLIAHSLRAEGFDASEDGTGRGTPIVQVAFDCKDSGADAHDDLAPTMRAMNFAESHANAGGQLAVATQWAVRRLTPRECERLQGIPDDHSRVPWRGRPAAGCPDGPRYRAIGNSWAVPIVHWIGARIGAALSEAAE